MTKEEAIDLICNDGFSLARLPPDLKKDPDVLLAACSQDPDALDHAPKELLEDADFILEALREDISAMEYASQELLDDPSFQRKAVCINWRALQYASDEVLEDRSVIIEATIQNWQALMYASPEVRGCWKLVQIALDQSGLALRFASEYMKKDRSLVLKAVKSHAGAFEFAPSIYQQDAEILLTAAQQSWQTLRFVPRWFRIELPVMLAAVKQNWKAVKFFLGDIRSEAELHEVARENPRIIQHPFLQVSREIVLVAVKKNGLVLQHASPTLRADREIVCAATRQNIKALQHASNDHRKDAGLRAMVAQVDKRNRSRLTRTLFDEDSDNSTPEASDGSGKKPSASSGLFEHSFGKVFVGSHVAPLERLVRLLDRAMMGNSLVGARRSVSKDISRESAVDELPRTMRRLLCHPYSRVFNLNPGDYGLRGGLPYYKPCGWARFAVRKDRKAIEDWAVAYHGTRVERAMWILIEGLQRPATWSEVAHGQAYSSTQRTIYLTPSVEYAGHPVYATLAKVGRCEWLQAVLQVRVRPGAFVTKPGSLGVTHWEQGVRIDPNFSSMDSLEWLIEDEKDVVVTGVLLRELGRCSDPLVYGDAAARVTEGEQGPEFEWTRLRCEQLREEGMMAKSLISL